eukprot:352901-Chlamydomonas_euryale.AAC.11
MAMYWTTTGKNVSLKLHTSAMTPEDPFKFHVSGKMPCFYGRCNRGRTSIIVAALEWCRAAR